MPNFFTWARRRADDKVFKNPNLISLFHISPFIILSFWNNFFFSIICWWMPIIVSCNFCSYFLLLSVAARAFDLKFFILKQQQPNNIIKPAVSHCSRKIFFSLSHLGGSAKVERKKLYEICAFCQKCVWSDETIFLYTFSVFFCLIYTA